MLEHTQVEDAQVVMTLTGSFADDPLLQRIRSEFHEMPGLCLTLPQAARLWNLDAQISQAALHALVNGGFLTRTDDGRYMAAGWSTREVSARGALSR
jgi:hypothetical protein